MRSIFLLCCIAGCGFTGRAGVGPMITTDGRAGAEASVEVGFHVLPLMPVVVRTEVAVLGDETQLLLGVGLAAEAPPMDGSRGGRFVVTRMSRLDDEARPSWRFELGLARAIGTTTNVNGCHNERQECFGDLRDIGVSSVSVSAAGQTSGRFTLAGTIERTQVTTWP